MRSNEIPARQECLHRYLNGRAPLLIARLRATPREDIAISVVTRGELFYGSAKSQTPERSRQGQVAFLSRFRSLTFDADIAEIYGNIRSRLETLGTPISHPDLQIAATALHYGVILVTHNTGEFSRVSSLTIEDWEI